MDATGNVTKCPVCGFDLGFRAWDGDSPSDEICPSCGMQFGYYDSTPDGAQGRAAIYAEWRRRWVEEGMPWNGASPPPTGWSPAEQLTRLG